MVMHEELYDSGGNLNPKELYNRLEHILALEAAFADVSKNGVPAFGDDSVMEHNALTASPLVFSLSDLIAYHGHVFGEKVSEERSKEDPKARLGILQQALREQKERVLQELRSECSLTAYSAIEAAVHRACGNQ